MRTVLALLASEEALSHRSSGLEGLAEESGTAVALYRRGLFPETYFVPRGASDLSVFTACPRCHDGASDECLAESGADLGLDSPEQALVLASIIERKRQSVGPCADQPSLPPSAEKEHEAANRPNGHLCPSVNVLTVISATRSDCRFTVQYLSLPRFAANAYRSAITGLH